MLYRFSNRRRAKDTILLILDEYKPDGMVVFVQDEMVIVDPGKSIPDDDIPVVMHYAEAVPDVDYDMSLDKITELYRGQGLGKFRV